MTFGSDEVKETGNAGKNCFDGADGWKSLWRGVSGPGCWPDPISSPGDGHPSSRLCGICIMTIREGNKNRDLR